MAILPAGSVACVNGKDRDLADSQVLTHELLKGSGDLEPADPDLYGDLPDAGHAEPELTGLQASAAVADSREELEAAHRKTGLSPILSIKAFQDVRGERRVEVFGDYKFPGGPAQLPKMGELLELDQTCDRRPGSHNGDLFAQEMRSRSLEK